MSRHELVFVVKFFVCKQTFHEYIFRPSRDYKAKMLRIIFLCEGQNSTFIVQFILTAVCIIFPEVAIDVECCTKKLFSTCGVKILEIYLWQWTFFSKVACWRLATLLKLKEFDQKYRTAANSRKAFWRTLFFPEHFALPASIFQIIYKSFQSISI